MMKSIPILVTAIALVVAVVLFSKAVSHRGLTDADSARRAGNPIPAVVGTVSTRGFVGQIPAECTSAARDEITIAARRSDAVVTETFARVGDRVSAGAVLLRLDDRMARLDADKAARTVEELHQELTAREHLFGYYRENRKEGLSREPEALTAEIDFLKTRAALAEAEAELAISRAELDRLAIAAPAAGVVVSIVATGNAGPSGDDLVKLAVDDPILLECQVAEDKLRFLTPGMAVETAFFAFPGQTFAGTLSKVRPVGDASKRTVTVAAELANRDGRIMPGLNAVARILDSREAVVVPSVSLINPGYDVAQLFVVDAEDRARLVRLDVGASAGGYTEVLKGVASGDRIVIAGQLGLEDGDPLRIVDHQEGGDAPR